MEKVQFDFIEIVHFVSVLLERKKTSLKRGTSSSSEGSRGKRYKIRFSAQRAGIKKLGAIVRCPGISDKPPGATFGYLGVFIQGQGLIDEIFPGLLLQGSQTLFRSKWLTRNIHVSGGRSKIFSLRGGFYNIYSIILFLKVFVVIRFRFGFRGKTSVPALPPKSYSKLKIFSCSL